MNTVDNIKIGITAIFKTIFSLIIAQVILCIFYYLVYWQRVPMDYFTDYIIHRSLCIVMFYNAVYLKYIEIDGNNLLERYEEELKLLKDCSKRMEDLIFKFSEEAKKDIDNN